MIKHTIEYIINQSSEFPNISKIVLKEEEKIKFATCGKEDGKTSLCVKWKYSDPHKKCWFIFFFKISYYKLWNELEIFLFSLFLYLQHRQNNKWSKVLTREKIGE